MIREAVEDDFLEIKEILVQHDMYNEFDDIDAMGRVRKLMGRYFLVAEEDSEVVGVIRACYDGSRAMINQIAVREEYRRLGIGKQLISGVCEKLREDGAPSISVTATEGSKKFYERVGFKDLPITVMVGYSIEEVIEKC